MTDPNVVQSAKEEEDIARAIQLSLDESKRENPSSTISSTTQPHISRLVFSYFFILVFLSVAIFRFVKRKLF